MTLKFSLAYVNLQIALAVTGLSDESDMSCTAGPCESKKGYNLGTATHQSSIGRSMVRRNIYRAFSRGK
jgi:hypothetical protein